MATLLVVQIIVVVVGLSWCIALAGIALFINRYMQTPYIIKNDPVLLRLARLLHCLTFGLTDCPFPESGCQEEDIQG